MSSSLQNNVTFKKSTKTIPLHGVLKKNFKAWLKASPAATKKWIKSHGFKDVEGGLISLPRDDGGMDSLLWIKPATPTLWDYSTLHDKAPEGIFCFSDNPSIDELEMAALGWQLGSYKFDRYLKDKKRSLKVLHIHGLDKKSKEKVMALSEGIALTRDLINTPTNDMGPSHLAIVVKGMAKKFKAKCSVIKGDQLLKKNLPAIHAVGRAAEDEPCLIDLIWGKKSHPKITLVGKGVCFDTGGLDLKPSSGMRLMKKDMGGAANVLGLAHMIMATGLPIRLRVLIPAVENAVSGNAYRPGDILETRKGLSVEVGNTDAEGRIVLCDALALADEEKPDLLIDLATLTGAARVAMGAGLPPVFSHDDNLIAALMSLGKTHDDPLWPLPLWEPYRDSLKSPIADLNNMADTGFGGAITAALYLDHFVTNTKSWAHIDLFGWNQANKPGRPKGGEAMTIRTLYAYLEENF
jgi:leucyl aminopeptidase